MPEENLFSPKQMERHPLEPFIPDGARLLMLGSFPPARHRWCMDFFYPNFTNDMWRIMGLCFYKDKNHFVDEQARTFRLPEIISLLKERGIAIFDTATAVIRTQGTASDKDLEVVEPTPLDALLARMPKLQAVVTTGEKATMLFAGQFGITAPKVGTFVPFIFQERTLRLYRMPSSSRAYPMKVERKAEYYHTMLQDIYHII
jgi:G:T/U-mismatch repair DNA glycosylase